MSACFILAGCAEKMDTSRLKTSVEEIYAGTDYVLEVDPENIKNLTYENSKIEVKVINNTDTTAEVKNKPCTLEVYDNGSWKVMELLVDIASHAKADYVQHDDFMTTAVCLSHYMDKLYKGRYRIIVGIQPKDTETVYRCAVEFKVK